MNDLAPEGLADRLVPEADAQDRDFSGERLDERHRNSRLVWRARPRGHDNLRRLEFFDALERDLVVAVHLHLLAEFAQVLHQVVGERIVVIQHQQHGSPQSSRVSRPASANSAARNSARALLWVSCHSAAGWESATTPPPA